MIHQSPNEVNTTLVKLTSHYAKIGLGLVPLDGKKPLGPNWQKNPVTQALTSGNVGLLHSHQNTCTLDLDHDRARDALSLVGIDLDSILELESAPYQIVGNQDRPPKPLFRLRQDLELSRKALSWPHPDNPKKLITIFELRAGPCQDVLPPSIHPDTHLPYTWLNDNVPKSLDHIPIIPEILLSLWLNWDDKLELLKAGCPWAEAQQINTQSVQNKPYDGVDVIGTYNSFVDVGDILERNDYERVEADRWLAPNSGSGKGGVKLLADNRVFSHHGSCLLADGESHDSFDCLAILEHNRDRKEAWKIARGELQALGHLNGHTSIGGHTAHNKAQDNLEILDGETPKADDLPAIQTNKRLIRDVSSDVYQALLAQNEPPKIFVKSGKLVRIISNEDFVPMAENISSESLKYYLERAANYFTLSYNKGDDTTKETPGPVPVPVVTDIMSYPSWGGLPALESIVTFPIFGKTGKLHTEAGYNSDSKLYYHKEDGLELGDYEPVGENITKAKAIIDDLLIDFPFADNASKTNAIALMITPFVKHYFDDPTPIFLANAPQFGTGKTLLIKSLISVSNQNVTPITAPKNPEEWEKKLISVLMSSPSHVFLDNIPAKLDSDILAAMTVTNDYAGRQLGVNQMIPLKIKNLWAGTGNNIIAHGELARRIVWLNLDSNLEKPWERTDFKHENILQWVKHNRSELLTACLTLISLWFETGCFKSEVRKGSFERWSEVVGGILETAGYSDFLANDSAMYDKANFEREPWLIFVNAWFDMFGQKPVGVKQLFPLASEMVGPSGDKIGEGILDELLDRETPRGRKTQFGALLKKKLDTTFGNFKIVSTKPHRTAAQYKLVDTKSRLLG